MKGGIVPGEAASWLEGSWLFALQAGTLPRPRCGGPGRRAESCPPPAPRRLTDRPSPSPSCSPRRHHRLGSRVPRSSFCSRNSSACAWTPGVAVSPAGSACDGWWTPHPRRDSSNKSRAEPRSHRSLHYFLFVGPGLAAAFGWGRGCTWNPQRGSRGRSGDGAQCPLGWRSSRVLAQGLLLGPHSTSVPVPLAPHFSRGLRGCYVPCRAALIPSGPQSVSTD